MTSDFESTVQPCFPNLSLRGGLPSAGDLALLHGAVVGSRAYGLDTAESDTDYRGVFVAGAGVQFSLDGPPAQLVDDAAQLCFWEVEKFLRLALKANPTVLETLYSPEVVHVNPSLAGAFARFRAESTFLSRRCHGSFLGYADAQFVKMQRSRERGTRFKWAHAMHLLRLLRVGIGVVRDGRFEVRVPLDERVGLLAIKRGEVAWEEVSAMREALTREFADAAASSPLPVEPDVTAAEAFLIQLRLDVAAAASR